MKVEVQERLSRQLELLIDEVNTDGLTLGELVRALRGRGFLALIVVLSVPFLQPVNLPGFSIILGVIIALIGGQLAFGRKPWLPGRLMNRSIPAEPARKLLRLGVKLFSKVERLLKPRFLLFHGDLFNRINGLMLCLCGVLLLLPLPPFPPGTNFLPALAVVLIALGMMERDGLFIAAGHILTALSTAYIILIFVAGAQAFDFLKKFF